MFVYLCHNLNRPLLLWSTSKTLLINGRYNVKLLLCVCVCVSLLPLLSSWPVHQSPERVSARHLVCCLLNTSFVCVCVFVCVLVQASVSLHFLLAIVCMEAHTLSPSLSLSLSLISVLLGKDHGWAISGDSCYEKITPLPTLSLFLSHTQTQQLHSLSQTASVKGRGHTLVIGSI